MDSEFITFFILYPQPGAWSAWSPWTRGVHEYNVWQVPISAIWVSYRMRQWTQRIDKIHTRQKCVLDCPAGYELSEDHGECIGPPQSQVSYFDGHASVTTYTPTSSPVHGTEATSTTDTDQVSWTETQWRFYYSIFNPGLLAAGTPVHQPHKAAILLHELIHGDQLLLGPHSEDQTLFEEHLKAWDVHLNHHEHVASEAIHSADLPLGTNFIDLTARDVDFAAIAAAARARMPGRWDVEVARVQLHISVVPPVELIAARPVVECRPTDERNGEDVAFRVWNRSRSQHAVRLDVTSAPAGWMGLLLGNPIRVLEPGEEDTVILRVERMNSSPAITEHLPFTVRLTMMDGVQLQLAAVAYVKPLS